MGDSGIDICVCFDFKLFQKLLQIFLFIICGTLYSSEIFEVHMKKALLADFLRLSVVVVFESLSSKFNTYYNETFRFILLTLNGILHNGHFVDFAAFP